MAKMSSKLFNLSRFVRDIEVISSGSPSKIGRRAVNKVVGRRLIRKVWLRPK